MRRRTILLVGVLVLIVLAAGAVAALPELVRRIAVTRIAELTGRGVTLEDVDLNLFTGRVALKGFRLAQRDGGDAALAFSRLDLRLSHAALLSKDIRLTELALAGPALRVARTGPTTFDFSDLLELIPPPDPNAKPSGWTVSVDRLSVRDFALTARDAAVTPAAQWRVDKLTIDATGITTRAGAAPGRLTVAAAINGSPLSVEATGIDLARQAAAVRVRLERFDLAQVVPYVPATVAAVPTAGTVDVTLAADVQQGGARGAIAGEVRLAGLALTRRGQGEAFATVGSLGVVLKEADLATLAIGVAAIEVSGLDLRASRDAKGEIDLLALAGAPAAGAEVPAGPPAAATGPALQLRVERVSLDRSRVTFVDSAVTPVTRLTVSDVTATVRDVSWPVANPAGVEASLTLPASGQVVVRGAVTPLPFDADLTVVLRNGSIAPYGAYFPFPARFAGSFNGDSRWRISLADGQLRAASTGDSWIDNLSVSAADAPAGTTPPARLDRLALSGIDFDWPRHARVKRVTITKPDVRIEREKDGTISLRRLFTPHDEAPAPAPAVVTTAAPAPPPARPADPAAADAPLLPIALDIGSIVIEDGFTRFTDRTLDPPFAESISRLNVRVDGLSSTPGRRARLTAQAVIGGDGALQVRGELAPLGRLYADLDVELRDIALPSATPYVDSLIGWTLQRGRMLAKLHYTIDGDTITATNDVTVGQLEVAPSAAEDRAQQRLGLPLGLILALIKDSRGDIKLVVPITGRLNDPSFDLSETIWTAIRNVIVNVVAAPFRAIGRLFTGGDNRIEKLSVEPVVFAAGSAVISPDMDRHLARVVSFLNGAPGIRLALAPLTSARDAEAVRAQEVTARVQALQREQKLADLPAAVAAAFRVRFPGVALPPTTEEQQARLVAEEPPPAERIAELRSRRLQAVMDTLVGASGVPAARLTREDGGDTTDGDGRIEFKIAP